MTIADEIYDLIAGQGILSKGDKYRSDAPRYAVGMLNEIRLYCSANSSPMGFPDHIGDIDSIAEVALEGIKKRLTGDET